MAPAEREAWLGRCDAEHDNFRAAIEYLVESGNAEWGLRLGSALFWFWEPREHLTEGRRALKALLDIPGANIREYLWRRALYAAGVLADAQLDFDSAHGHHELSLEIQRQLGDKEGIATAESALAIGSNKAGRYVRRAPIWSGRCCSGKSSAPAGLSWASITSPTSPRNRAIMRSHERRTKRHWRLSAPRGHPGHGCCAERFGRCRRSTGRLSGRAPPL